MATYVRYLYPVYVEIDADEGEVLRVVVDDESAPEAVDVLDDSFAPLPGPLRGAGLRVAEAPWPSWEFGW